MARRFLELVRLVTLSSRRIREWDLKRKGGCYPYVASPRNQFDFLKAGPRRPAFLFCSLCRVSLANLLFVHYVVTVRPQILHRHQQKSRCTTAVARYPGFEVSI
jgi:hypothetical protein